MSLWDEPSPGIDISLPHNGWLPRDHQRALWSYLENGGKRAIAIWHRRAGKDEVCLHHAAKAMQLRAGNYWHCLPEYGQARKAIWTAVNPHSGKRRIDEAFPLELRESTNDHEMFIRYKTNGSTFQLIGSDRYDQTVGSGVAGLTFSEWALANPSSWAYYKPMVEENGGWAVFITTPRGRNHAHSMFEHAQSHSSSWFSELLTASDTGALSADQLEDALEEYCSIYGEDQGRSAFEQEYMCSWSALNVGAFYAREMKAVRDENRIIDMEALPDLPVHRAWDLGMRDDTALWWFQVTPSGQLYILDHISTSGSGPEYFKGEIDARIAEHGWRDGTDYVPHDARVKEWTAGGRTRIETMQALGLNPQLAPAASVEDGRNAVRRTLPLCVFHPRTSSGIDALEQYRREWDDEKKAFRSSHLHNWTTHPADSFRYLSLSWRAPSTRMTRTHLTLPGWQIPPPADIRAGGIVF